jgi:ligand-binding sensor domain-containing protein
MKAIFRLLCCLLLVVCNLSAYAAAPETDAFEVSGIRFGNSYDEVQQIARRLELRQVRHST